MQKSNYGGEWDDQMPTMKQIIDSKLSPKYKLQAKEGKRSKFPLYDVEHISNMFKET